MAKQKFQKLGPPVDLEAVFSSRRLRNHIFRIGVELEGGWNKVPTGCSGIIRDGSVTGLVTSDGSRLVAAGELPSPILFVKKSDGTAEGMRAFYPEWIKSNYPQTVNQTCGMHVHMSFTNPFTYQRLMNSRYPATVIAHFLRWAQTEGLPSGHPIWPRLRGESEYCQHVFQADDQAVKASKEYDHHGHGHRYTVINYSYTRHSTVECRLLPMFDNHEVATRAVEEVMRVTNGFLAATAKRERPIVREVADIEAGELNVSRVVRV